MLSFVPDSGELPVLALTANGKFRVRDIGSRTAVFECLRGALGASTGYEPRFPQLHGPERYTHTGNMYAFGSTIVVADADGIRASSEEKVARDGTLAYVARTDTLMFR